jgi:hypothetical protein
VAAIGLVLASCAGPFGSTTHPAQRHPMTTPQVGALLVGANVDISQAAGSQDEVSAAVDPADPTILLAGSNSLQDDPSVRVYGSGDVGLRWSSNLLPLPTTSVHGGAMDQWAAIGPDHRQAMAYIAFGRFPSSAGTFDGLTLFVATRSGPGAAWQAPASPLDGLPPKGSYDDKPTLAFDNSTTSSYRGWLYAAWTRWMGQDGWLLVSHSADGGHTWTAPQALRQQGQNWGAALTLAPDGTLVVAWAGDDFLWIARSGDGGEHFSSPHRFDSCRGPMSDCVNGATIPAQSDAGVRANPALVAIPPSAGQPAQVLAFYANGDGTDTRIDMARIDMARIDAASLTLLGSPSIVPLGASGTDQFLPAAAYDAAARTLWVCAYVSLASAPTQARYTCTASRDGGGSFLPATPVAAVASDEEQPGAYRSFIGRQYGDYTAVVAAAGVAHAFWTDSRRLGTLGEEIFTATLQVNPRASGTG